MPIRNVISKLLRDETGATAVEYGLILAMIVIAMIAALSELASEIISMWGFVETEVTTV